MIIVEGPDGAGKSTLVEKLARDLSLPVAEKLVNSDMSANMSKKVWCEMNVREGFRMRLHDRHCLISEPIYNSVTKRDFDPGFDDVDWYNTMMHMFYRYCRPLIIYCLPSYEVVRQNVLEGGIEQPKRVREGVRKIYAQYVAKAASDIPLAGAVIYDYTKHDTDHIYAVVQGAIERMSGVPATH